MKGTVKSVKIIVYLLAVILIGGFLIKDFPNGKMLVSFIDVGQGDCIYIRTPDDYHIVVDSGPSMSVLEKLNEVLPRYNRTIDLIVITHPHADHINGFVEILKRYDVKRLLLVGTSSWNPFYKKILELSKGVDVIYAQADKDFKIGKYLFLDILWPKKSQVGKEYENLNNASVAMRVITENAVFMLSGDAEKEEESEMLKSGFDLSADILKAGHHGSRTASSDEFLDAIAPSAVVIQSGKGNDFGHPHKETLEKLLERGIEVRRNDVEGRVDFIFFQS